MNLWVISFIASTAFASIGFVVVAILWLKKLRETLSCTLAETAGQQVRNAQHVSKTLSEIQLHQELYEQRLQTLTEANIRMRQDLNEITNKIALSESEQQMQKRSLKNLH